MVEPMFGVVADWGRQDAVAKVSPYGPTFGSLKERLINAFGFAAVPA